MTAFERCRRWASAAALGLAAASAWGAPADSLVGSWQTVIDGDPQLRTLRVARVEEAAQGELRVIAHFGWHGQRLLPVRATATEAEGVLRLKFTTPVGTHVDVTAAGDDALRGWVRAGETGGKPIQLNRMQPGEDTATVVPAFYIVKPGADVPAHCAAFSGLWEGDWIFGARGRAWIWVLEVDASCQAKVALQRELRRPSAFRLVQIDGGVAVIEGANGRDVYRRWGDELHGVGSTFLGDTLNRVALKRIADPLP